MSEIAFVLVLSLFLTHELDAMAHHEWRVFPLTMRLNDERGRQVYALAHIPLFFTILWLCFAEPATADIARGSLSSFAIIHVYLHWQGRNHPRNEFSNALSQAVIWATGVVGAIYLAMRLAGG